MYKRIAEKKPALEEYTNKLLEAKTFTSDDIDEHKKWVWGMLEDSFSRSKDYQPTAKEWLTSAWNGFKSPKELATEVLPHEPTAVDAETLKHVGQIVGNAPDEFNVHRNLKRILNNRTKMVQEGKGIDMSTAEALAFGSLCLEGHHVRVSGQDVERGTFSQRHAVLHDQESEVTYTPLKHVGKEQGSFVIANNAQCIIDQFIASGEVKWLQRSGLVMNLPH